LPIFIGRYSLITDHLIDVLEDRYPRMSDISEYVPDNLKANHKGVWRFIAESDIQLGLMCLYQQQARFVIGDLTKISWREARNMDGLSS
jgi:hypothetical protein